MIDREAFAQGMGRLGGAFGREIDGPVAAFYFDILSPQLTTEEWAEAVTRAAAQETFWPSPAVLLAKVKLDPESQAAAALSNVRRVLNGYGQMRDVPLEAVRFDAATWAGLKAIGGLKNARDEKYEKRFTKAYAEHFTPRPQIAAGGAMQSEARRLIDGTARKLTLVSGRDAAAGKDND